MPLCDETSFNYILNYKCVLSCNYSTLKIYCRVKTVYKKHWTDSLVDFLNLYREDNFLHIHESVVSV